MRYCLDVYSGNGVMDWSGQQGKLAYLKYSQGSRHLDSEYNRNVAECTRLGIKWGAYHFVDGSPGDNQFDLFSAAARASWLPPALDVEQIDGVPDGAIWASAYQMVMRCLNIGRVPLIYTDRSMTEALNKLPGYAKTFAVCPLWLADYETSPATPESAVHVPLPWSYYWLRQYTATATVGGKNEIDVSVTGRAADAWLTLTK